MCKKYFNVFWKPGQLYKTEYLYTVSVYLVSQLVSRKERITWRPDSKQFQFPEWRYCSFGISYHLYIMNSTQASTVLFTVTISTVDMIYRGRGLTVCITDVEINRLLSEWWIPSSEKSCNFTNTSMSLHGEKHKIIWYYNVYLKGSIAEGTQNDTWGSQC